MNSTNHCPGDAASLREQAEVKIAGSPHDGEPLSPEATRLALHELQVHQIELEMQNEELRRSRAELDAARARYFDLYDLAPVGYVTVSEHGLILEANLTAAALLGVDRGALVKQPFSCFIGKADAESYYRLRRRLMKTGEPQVCELRMVNKGGAVFWAHLAATSAQDSAGTPECRIVLDDITERKQSDTYKELGRDILHILNEQGTLKESVGRIIETLRMKIGLDAVGFRLQEGDDFPYFSQQGFPEDFLLRENSLTGRGADGALCRDSAGNVCLECTCGLVVSGKSDPDRPFLTRGGSFWTSDSFPLLDLPHGQDPRRHPRNECVHQGYNSVALIPLKDKHRIVGLIQLSARRKGVFSLADVEFLEGIAAQVGAALMRRRAEEQLQEKEESYHMLADSGMALIWTSGTDKKCDYFNQPWLRFTGRTLEQELGDGWAEGVHPDDLARCFKIYTEAFDRRETFSMDYRLRCHDGEFRWIQDDGTPRHDSRGNFLGYIGHCMDITERKRAEEALQISDDRFARLAEQSGTFIWEVDPQGLYTYVSPVVEKVLGYRPDELIGRMHFYDLHPEAERETFKQAAFAVIQKKGFFKDFVNSAQAKDGRAVWLAITGQPHLNVDGSLLGYRGSDTDVSARKLAEDERQKIDKLQSVGTLAGGIAHDFNNILQGLYGNISLAMDDLSETHPSYGLLEDAEKSMNRAIRLTTQLLTFSKGGDPVKESVGLGAMVDEIARFDLAGSSVSLVYQHAEDLWPVDADRGQVQQVISNLVINARQAMSKGGHLIVTLENVSLPDEALPSLRRGRYVKVTVQDEGEGIAPDVLGKIFDPYFTTKQTGNGLGLATVWSIINKHGGHIGVESELGKGTTFTVYLPAAALPQLAESKPLAVECLTSASPAKILVMDDDEMVCNLAGKMLMPCGYSVATAPDGQEAVSLYRQALETGAPFDAVILDMTIPGGPGGKEVVKDLQALDPHVRALVSSGYADDPVMANPAAYGFKGVVAKPYTGARLREAVARVLA